MPSATPIASPLARSEAELGLALSDVVVVFSCNEAYVPYLSVVLQSLCENASCARRYDIVVLTTDIGAASAAALRAQVEGLGRAALAKTGLEGEAGAEGPFHIGFLDTRPVLEGVRFPHHNRFGPETYYRLLAPELLPGVGKAVYLDADLCVLHDVAELFDVDVSGSLLAAILDPDTAGQVCGYDPMVRPYLEHEVGLADPGSYLQAGVLLMNLAEFRRTHPASELMGLASSRRWRWCDQDILNHLVQGSYVRLDPRWNVLHDWRRLRRTHIVAQAPAEVRAAYEKARTDPWIVHYAGPDNRPWLYPKADMAGYFWDYAARCPFEDTLRARLAASWRSPRRLGKRAFLHAIYAWGLPAFDVVFAYGTRRRRAVIGAYERLGGQCT